MKHQIDRIAIKDYQEVLNVWEASIRATHHFLKEEDIAYFKPLILNTYLDAVELRGDRDDKNKIIGFIGGADKNLEMLFIHPNYRAKGIGENLLEYAIGKLNVAKVDVNEQNEQAVGFYQHFGFKIIGRSELDSSAKPYPVLHMELK